METETPSPPTAFVAAGVWLALAYNGVVDAGHRLARRLADDRGVEDSPSKLIFLAVAVAIAIAAGLFIIGVFNDAQDNVPDPVAPSP
ncbi:MAG: hypothetical protein QNJ12_22690 [Ilumatobacter sp.]|uniref:hypothetical protein n=1 Tax=Ilumatobacter sp. TaxID=1967498 RepID=UPI0026166EEB|nr:hypothetical protein [Ilumatobacter sp.]MDJ0771611.1 hypothetical protein [Ilumatobacter sp.]